MKASSKLLGMVGVVCILAQVQIAEGQESKPTFTLPPHVHGIFLSTILVGNQPVSDLPYFLAGDPEFGERLIELMHIMVLQGRCIEQMTVREYLRLVETGAEIPTLETMNRCYDWVKDRVSMTNFPVAAPPAAAAAASARTILDAFIEQATAVGEMICRFPLFVIPGQVDCAFDPTYQGTETVQSRDPSGT